MSSELSRCYELLGVKPGVSVAELKVAYRDMAKVWHPDRFGHDERLQKKAQEKLKEINEAYEALISGNTPRPTSTSSRERRASSIPNESRSSYATNQATPSRSISWKWVVVPLLIFGAVFFVTSRSLLRSSPSAGDTSSQEVARPVEATPVQSTSDAPSDVSARNNKQTAPHAETKLNDVAATETNAAPLQPMKTVTVLIDPATGLLARVECPAKTKVTYPAGKEPHGSCTALHASKSQAQAESGESRVKSIAKRVVSPAKWLGDSKDQ